jgi:hypothetical protein
MNAEALSMAMFVAYGGVIMAMAAVAGPETAGTLLSVAV